MLVFVLNKHGQALMPCSCKKARILLKNKSATVAKLQPFTIQLLYGSFGYTQQCVLRTDKGSSYIGVSVVSEKQVLISAKINHRTDVSKKMTNRATLRRARRSRLWYRACRFINRSSSKRTDRLAPSVALVINDIAELKNGITVGGISRIPNLPYWAFCTTKEENERFFDVFPKVNILVSHAPYDRHEELTSRYSYEGIPSAREYIKRNDVGLFICGHIHEAYGSHEIDGISYNVVSICNEQYEPVNPITILDYKDKNDFTN